MNEFIEVLSIYRETQSVFFEESSRRKIDHDYKKAGRRCRKALKRVRRLAAKHGILWDTGDGARTFY